MHSASQQWPGYQLPQSRGNGPLGRARDWLDQRGRTAWILAIILGFIVFWPVGLGLLAYMIGSNRMFTGRSCRYAAHRLAPSSGNLAFDAYRDETLKRLEEEHREFLEFLQKLREAKDKAEFDQFMQQRGERDDRSED